MGNHIESVLIAALIATVALSPAACTMHRHSEIAGAIKAGVDPILAKCAIEYDSGRDAICIARAQQVQPRGRSMDELSKQ